MLKLLRVMNIDKDKLEKAIEYAIASLKIDGIHLSQEFLDVYRKKYNLEVTKRKVLVYTKEKNNHAK